MKIYTIVGGVNGVGKSSFTGVLKSRTTDLGVIVDVDKITAQMGGKALEGGKRADLIVTAGNPLEDLRALREVEMVMCGGRLVRHPKVKRIPAIEEQIDRLL